jgi:hypothetical protein
MPGSLFQIDRKDIGELPKSSLVFLIDFLSQLIYTYYQLYGQHVRKKCCFLRSIIGNTSFVVLPEPEQYH